MDETERGLRVGLSLYPFAVTFAVGLIAMGGAGTLRTAQVPVELVVGAILLQLVGAVFLFAGAFGALYRVRRIGDGDG